PMARSARETLAVVTLRRIVCRTPDRARLVHPKTGRVSAGCPQVSAFGPNNLEAEARAARAGAPRYFREAVMSKEQRRILVGGALAAALIAGATFVSGGQRSALASVLPGPTLTNTDELNMVARAENFAATMNSAFRSVSGVRRRPRFAFAFVARDGHLLNTAVMDD